MTVKCGVQLWDGLRVEDDVFIGPNATFTNDLFPRCRVQRTALPPTTLRRGCLHRRQRHHPARRHASVAGAMVGAGTVITADVPANAVVVGNPTRIIGYADADAVAGPLDLPAGAPCAAVRAEVHRDARGRLSHWPLETALPFVPRRLYVVDGAPDGWARGGGAYRRSHQFLVATQGALTVAVDDGRTRLAVRLSGPEAGLHVPPGTWTLQFGHTADASLLVLASEPFDPSERVADYGDLPEPMTMWPAWLTRRVALDLGLILLAAAMTPLLFAALRGLGLPFGLRVVAMAEDYNWLLILQSPGAVARAQTFWTFNDRNPLSPWWYIAGAPALRRWRERPLPHAPAMGPFLGLSLYAMARAAAMGRARGLALGAGMLGAAWVLHMHARRDRLELRRRPLPLPPLASRPCRLGGRRAGQWGWYGLSLALWYVAFGTYGFQVGAVVGIGLIALLHPPPGREAPLPRLLSAAAETIPYAFFLVAFALSPWRCGCRDRRRASPP